MKEYLEELLKKTEGISRIISWEARENANLIWIEDTNKQAQSFKLYLNWIFGSLRKKCFGIASLKVKETCGGISREARGDFFLGNFKKEFSVKLHRKPPEENFKNISGGAKVLSRTFKEIHEWIPAWIYVAVLARFS